MLRVRTALRSSVTLFALIAAPATYAQDETNPSTAGQAAAKDESSAPESTIIVTGTRIARPELESAMPVDVVSMQDSERFGRTTAYDALISQPSVGVGIGPGSAQGQSWDAGISSVSLRNLGTNRSLTLIDGMRRVSGSAQSSAVDLAMIPSAMIERVEIVTGGAAAIYGADAVTGAVNVITKKDFTGVELSAQTGVSSHGDMNRVTVSGVVGGSFADGRGRFIAGATYYHTPELPATARKYAAGLTLYLANPANTGAADGIPDQILLRNWYGFYISSVPNFYFNGATHLYQDGALVTGVYGKQYTTGEFSGGTGGVNRYPNNYVRGNKILEELNSLATSARVDYELSNSLKLTARGDFGKSVSFNAPNNSNWRDDSRSVWFSGAGGAVAYLDNPYLPDPIRQYMLANKLTSLNIDRVYTNVPPQEERHDRQTINLFGSVGGNLGSKVTWEAFAQYGESKDDVEFTSVPYTSHWVAARDAIADPVTGQPICRSAAARAAGCIPFDIFGAQATPEQIAYITGTGYESRLNRQVILGGNVSGALFKLPYGDLSFSLGAEHRRETLVTKNPTLALGNELIGPGQLASHPELDARAVVSELYGELVAPLLKDLPFAYRLEIEGAYRYSDYNSFGGVSTWKIGGNWAPFRGLTLRGVRSRSVRAPNFGELYLPQVDSVTGSILDPCGAGRYSATAARAANCAALGITTPLPSIYPDALVITAGGNPNLRPETSDSFTLGAVVQPAFVPNLNITVDYFSIDIKDVITQYSYLNTLNLCVDLPSIDNPFCKNVVRGPDGKVTHIYINQTNAAQLKDDGIDFSLDYRHPLFGGRIGLVLNGTYLLNNIVHSTPGIATGDVRNDGGYANPRFKGNLIVSYDEGSFSAAFATRYTSKSLYYPNNVTAEFVDQNRVPAIIYNDISLQVEVEGGVALGAGVNNIFNERPPIFPGLDTGGSGLYDAIGRYFFVSARVKL